MFDRPETAADLRARSGELQTALAAAGFDLSGGITFSSTDPVANALLQQPDGARSDTASAWQGAGQGFGDPSAQDGSSGSPGRRATLFNVASELAVAGSHTLASGLARRGVDVRI